MTDVNYDITDALTEGCLTEVAAIDAVAKSKFLDTLVNNKEIDVEAFHKAYDAAIIEAKLADLFNDNGLLKSRGTYGEIKNCVNSDLKFGLVKLWVAQYKDMLVDVKTAEAKREKERQEQEAQELKKKEMEEKANKANEELLKALPQHELYKNINTNYKLATGKNIEEVAQVKAMNVGRNEYGVTTTDSRSYYPFSEENLTDTDKMCKRVFDLINRLMEDKIKEVCKKKLDELLAKYNIKGIDELRFIDLKTNQKYYIEEDEKGAMIYIPKDHLLNSLKDLTQMPDFDKLKLVCAVKTIESTSRMCYSSTYYKVYYDPTLPEDILKECGVFLEETGGGNGETRCYFMDPEEIPTDIRAAGFTKGEDRHYEIDSSD